MILKIDKLEKNPKKGKSIIHSMRKRVLKFKKACIEFAMDFTLAAYASSSSSEDSVQHVADCLFTTYQITLYIYQLILKVI